MKFLKFDKELSKVFSLNTLNILSKLISGFILNKVLAIYVGPQGLGLLGNLRNFLNSLKSISTLGFYRGIVKYTAEFNSNKQELPKVLSTSFITSGVMILLVSVILLSAAPYWSNLLFNTYEYSTIFRVLAISFPFYLLNFLCIAILNGKEKYKAYIISNILTNILGLIITLFLVVKFNLNGILYAVIITPSLGLGITFFLYKNQLKELRSISLGNYNTKTFKNLLEFSLMALVTAILAPVTSIAIRNHIINTESLIEAGYWESINRISNNYLVFISTLINLYFYPKLVRSTNLKREILSFYKTILPLITIGFVIIYILRGRLTLLLFSEAFLPIEKLYFWQLLGDFFKISSSIMAYQFFAKKMTKDFIITEVISTTILYLSTIYFVNTNGYIGGSMGYFLCQFLYFLLLMAWFRKSIFTKYAN